MAKNKLISTYQDFPPIIILTLSHAGRSKEASQSVKNSSIAAGIP